MFADEKKRGNRIHIRVDVNEQTREYDFEAVALVGIKKDSKCDSSRINTCDLEGEVMGINGGGMNKRHLLYGLRNILKRLRRYRG